MQNRGKQTYVVCNVNDDDNDDKAIKAVHWNDFKDLSSQWYGSVNKGLSQAWRPEFTHMVQEKNRL